MYRLLPQYHSPISKITPADSTNTIIPTDVLSEAVFAGDSFLNLEAAFGRVDGVTKTATGYCGGTLKKPNYREVCEGRAGHTEAVKLFYDKRKVSYRSLCDIFWETHDPTNRNYLNFGLSTHQRSAIYYSNEEERKQAQESKIRQQMKLNKRIVTKIISFGSDFYMAENQYQKYYLQKCCWVCESLSLRSTEQFVESTIACKLNGIFFLNGSSILDELRMFLVSNELSTKTKIACQEIMEDITRAQGRQIDNANKEHEACPYNYNLEWDVTKRFIETDYRRKTETSIMIRWKRPDLKGHNLHVLGSMDNLKPI